MSRPLKNDEGYLAEVVEIKENGLGGGLVRLRILTKSHWGVEIIQKFSVLEEAIFMYQGVKFIQLMVRPVVGKVYTHVVDKTGKKPVFSPLRKRHLGVRDVSNFEYVRCVGLASDLDQGKISKKIYRVPN